MYFSFNNLYLGADQEQAEDVVRDPDELPKASSDSIAPMLVHQPSSILKFCFLLFWD